MTNLAHLNGQIKHRVKCSHILPFLLEAFAVLTSLLLLTAASGDLKMTGERWHS